MGPEPGLKEGLIDDDDIDGAPLSTSGEQPLVRRQRNLRRVVELPFVFALFVAAVGRRVVVSTACFSAVGFAAVAAGRGDGQTERERGADGSELPAHFRVKHV